MIAPQNNNNNNNMMMIIIIVIVVIAILGGVVYFMSLQESTSTTSQTTKDTTKDKDISITSQSTKDTSTTSQTSAAGKGTSTDTKPLVTPFETNFAYKGSGSDQAGLIWAKDCGKSWNAKYLIGCREKNNSISWSKELGPVTNSNLGGPIIRIGPDGMTECAKKGGLVTIKRQKDNGDWENITSKVNNSNDDATYDRKDSILL
jgi:hypothetical protein